MKKMTVTITGFDKETMRYIVEKIEQTASGLILQLGDQVSYLAPAREMPKIERKELIILTPFHTDRTPVCNLAPGWYKALVPSPFREQAPKEYRFRSPFNLRQIIKDIERKFPLDHRLMDLPIIFCVKRKDTENSWRGRIERILTEER